eukprot:6412753-Lingulodinium_polyedra.AAC.1
MPGGGGFEHWAPVARDNETREVVASTLARLAVGDLPEPALKAFLAARLAGIKQASGGLRILGGESHARRI